MNQISWALIIFSRNSIKMTSSTCRRHNPTTTIVPFTNRTESKNWAQTKIRKDKGRVIRCQSANKIWLKRWRSWIFWNKSTTFPCRHSSIIVLQWTAEASWSAVPSSSSDGDIWISIIDSIYQIMYKYNRFVNNRWDFFYNGVRPIDQIYSHTYRQTRPPRKTG